MKIPKVHGRNKIRDTKICRLWAQDLMDIPSIAFKFKLSQPRIYSILYNNREFLQLDRNWEKIKRIYWIKKKIHQNDTTKKDTADLQEQLRREIEGEKPLMEQHITKIDKVEVVISDETQIPLTQQTGRGI